MVAPHRLRRGTCRRVPPALPTRLLRCRGYPMWRRNYRPTRWCLPPSLRQSPWSPMVSPL
eukprot:7196385-Alexandrium_andersonii.AAC.1